jgi:hypothetical protein
MVDESSVVPPISKGVSKSCFGDVTLEVNQEPQNVAAFSALPIQFKKRVTMALRD